jgi:beta-lactamase class A
MVIIILVAGILTWQLIVNKIKYNGVHSKTVTYDNMWLKINKSLNNSIASRSDLEVSISIIDVNNNTQKDFGISDGFEGASTTKVLSAIVFLHEVENNEQNLNEQVGDFSASFQLQEMINQSDDDSWVAINQLLGHDELSEYAKSIGLNSYDPDQNIITAHDDANLLKMLYQGKLLNNDDTKLLLSWMQNTNDETMIPEVISKEAVIYHKYGALDDRLHDTAIIIYKNHPIILSIYTKSTSGTDINLDSRAIFIRQLTSDVLPLIDY